MELQDVADTQAAGSSGRALRTALHGIIKGHRRFSYTCVWTILEDADVDPANPDNVIALYRPYTNTETTSRKLTTTHCK